MARLPHAIALAVCALVGLHILAAEPWARLAHDLAAAAAVAGARP